MHGYLIKQLNWGDGNVETPGTNRTQEVLYCTEELEWDAELQVFSDDGVILLVSSEGFPSWHQFDFLKLGQIVPVVCCFTVLRDCEKRKWKKSRLKASRKREKEVQRRQRLKRRRR